MQDTSIDFQDIYHKILMSKTGEERFLMGISLFQIARELVLASFPKNISNKQKKKLLLERFYGRELDQNPFKYSTNLTGQEASDFATLRRDRKRRIPYSSLLTKGKVRDAGKKKKKQKELTSEVAMKKLKQFAMLYEMAWELKRAAFQKKYPQLENAEINKLTAKVFTMAKT